MYVVHEFPLSSCRSVSDINFGLRKDYRFGAGAVYLGEVVFRIKAKGIRAVSRG